MAIDFEKIYKYLNDNKIYPEEIWNSHDDLHDIDRIVVSIRWGDWKHEHLRCDWLMSELGYIKDGVVETEEDGSDCYSADHYYIMKEA